MNQSYKLMGLGTDKDVIPNKLDSFRRGYSLNTGNLLFNYAADKISVLDKKSIPWSTPAEEVNKTSGLVIPMANHLGPHSDLKVSGPKLDNVKVPVIALGLGAQFSVENYDLSQIAEGTVEWIKECAKLGKDKNISVRGEFTYKVMKELGIESSAVILGCPSLLINPHIRLGKLIKDKFNKMTSNINHLSFAVTAGNPLKPGQLELEKSLVKMINKYNGDYVIQHPRIFHELANNWEIENEKSAEGIRNKMFPELSLDDMKFWFRNKGRVYINVPQWMMDMTRKDFVIGTRIHGIQAAIQAGTPAVCLYIDSRTKELCEIMKIPHIYYKEFENGIDLDKCFAVLEKWSGKEFDDNRKILAAKTEQFLLSNGFPVSDHLKKLAGTL